MFIKILALKQRAGKCERNDEMITPTEWSVWSKPEEKLRVQLLSTVYIPLKRPFATCKGEYDWFYLWQSSAKRYQIVNCLSYPDTE